MVREGRFHSVLAVVIIHAAICFSAATALAQTPLSRSPQVSMSFLFHTGIEFPTPTTVNNTHHGTAGFTSVLRSRQVALYEMVGFHSTTASE